jgi:hypothetical protein
MKITLPGLKAQKNRITFSCSKNKDFYSKLPNYFYIEFDTNKIKPRERWK